MKIMSMIAGTLLILANFATAQAQQQNIQITNLDYKLVAAQLDQKRFVASNVNISLFNFSEQSLILSIMNDICPHVPGKPKCMAMPYPMFYGEFKLGAAKTDTCGVRIQKSVLVLNNGERAQLEIKDFRLMTCEIVYLADFELTLKLKKGKEKSVSTILVSKVDTSEIPGIYPPPLLLEPTEQD